MHNWPGMPVGVFGIRAGAFFASTDEIDITVRGKGGHAAKPELAVDTIVAASHIVTALQTIVSRNTDPVQQLVVSITTITSSSNTQNVLPASVHLRGTIRAMGAEARALGRKRVEEVAKATAQVFGAEAEVNLYAGYPTMVNADVETEYARQAARTISGDCVPADMTMGAEDFAYMLEERPGAYILVGNGDSAPVHHPAYDFDDSVIPAGCSWWVEMAESRLPLHR